MKLIEAVTSSMTKMLIAQLPAKIDDINASFSDGVIVDTPARYLDYEPNLNEVPDRPLCLVIAGQSRPINDTGFGGGGWADYEHMVLVSVLVEEPDPQVLAKKLLRTQSALVQTIGANRTGVLDADGIQAWGGLSISVTDPGERFQAGPMNSYMQVTGVVVKATRTEA